MCPIKKILAHNLEGGAILPLLSILILTLLSLTALAVDSTFLIASKSQQENLSLHVALSSLKTYNNTQGTVNNTQVPVVNKLNKVKDQAKSLVGVNFILGSPEANLNPDFDSVVKNQAGDSGSLLPGIWHFQPNVENNLCIGNTPCPCKEKEGDSGKVWAGPCFEAKSILEIDTMNTSTPSSDINAFKVDLKIKESTPIKTFFSTVLGQSAKTYDSKATASVLPVHALFLLDLSRRSHILTHLPFEFEKLTDLANRPPAEYSYQISNLACPILAAGHPPPCGYQNPIDGVNYPCSTKAFTPSTYTNNYLTNKSNFRDIRPPPPTNCEIIGGINENLYDAVWDRFCVDKSNRDDEKDLWDINPGPIRLDRDETLPTNPRAHFKSDYSCFPVSYKDPLLGNDIINQNYLVDTYRYTDNAAPAYYGAEPLASMLWGTRYAMNDLIAARRVSNEEVGILAFDQSAVLTDFDEAAASELASTSGKTVTFSARRRFDLVAAKTDTNPNENGFEKLLRLTDVTITDRTTVVANLQESLFFARTDANSNLPQALSVALEMMLKNQKTRGLSYEAHVVLFTDGLSNCTILGDCGGNMLSDIQPSIEKVLNDVVPEYVKRNIKLHIFQFANRAVGPHNIMRQSVDDPSSCMQDSEARGKGLAYVHYDEKEDNEIPAKYADKYHDILSAAWGEDDVRYFLPTAKLYEATKATGGTWAPIKPKCAATTDIATSCANKESCISEKLEDYLNTRCAKCGEEQANEKNDCSVSDGIVKNLAGFTDSSGRLLCSPYSMREQIARYMDDIFKRNPYVIVE